MTEGEWERCPEPPKMLEFLRTTCRSSERTGRLFTAASFARMAGASPTDPRRIAGEVLERFADGHASVEELLDARRALTSLDWDLDSCTRFPRWEAARAAIHDSALFEAHGVYCALLDKFKALPGEGVLAEADAALETTSDLVAGRLTSLLRDIFGPRPFREVRLDLRWLTWDGGTMAKLARTIDEERTFDRLPILADALEEAGCANDDILRHCRQRGLMHVRGCWVVDLLLGKG